MRYTTTIIALAAAAMGHGYKPYSAMPTRTRHNGPGTAKSYLERPGSGLLTREEIKRRRGGNSKGSYTV